MERVLWSEICIATGIAVLVEHVLTADVTSTAASQRLSASVASQLSSTGHMTSEIAPANCFHSDSFPASCVLPDGVIQ
jgi:hypothetical protein